LKEESKTININPRIDQAKDPRIDPQGAHPSQIITLRELNHVGTEERCNLATFH
jgi:hypothetical protein